MLQTKNNMGAGRPPKTPDQIDEFAPLAGEIKKANKPYRPRLERKSVTFRLVGDFRKDESGNIKYPQTYIINNEYPLWDEDRKAERTARVLRGVSSIWRDEQNEKNITEKYAQANKVEFVFTNGKLTIPTMQQHHIEYLRKRADFKGCKNPCKNVKIRFEEVDTEANELKAFEEMEKRQDAIRKALDSDYEDAIAHFKHLGGNMMNDEGNELSEEGFRSAYVRLAEQKTDMFLKTYDNPFVKMFGLVRLGFEQNKLTFVDGQVSWTDTKTFICQVPADKQGQVSDFLAQMMLTKDGMELRSRLEQLK